jgi:hypothetical protein
MWAKFHIHQRSGGLPKKSISIEGYAEIQIQRPFFDNKNGIEGNNIFIIQTARTCALRSPTHRNFSSKEISKPQFVVVFLNSTYLLWRFCRWAVRELDKRLGTYCLVG